MQLADLPPMQPTTRGLSFLVWIAFTLFTFIAPSFGAFSPPGDWYASLNKPSWNPPAWLFGPVWTALYLMMATAAWLVWKRSGWGKAMAFYGIQLVFNAAWTPIFFGAHQPGWALVDIIAMWVAIAVTMIAFFRVSKAAGWLMVPYFAWVSFAMVLNFTLWRMN
jgi:tryptophan-rich sensory protein